MKEPKFPIYKNFKASGNDGNIFEITIDIIQTTDLEKFKPDGIKAVFKLVHLRDAGPNELLILIDNHEPYDYHQHTKLPEIHDFREKIHAKDYQEAWDIFHRKTKELLNET